MPNFSNLSSSFSPKLKTPQSMRAGFNPSTGEFTGLSKKREPISQETAIASQDREKNPQAVAEISEFHQETAGAPGKSADKVMATSPTTSGNYDLGEGLLNTVCSSIFFTWCCTHSYASSFMGNSLLTPFLRLTPPPPTGPNPRRSEPG